MRIRTYRTYGNETEKDILRSWRAVMNRREDFLMELVTRRVKWGERQNQWKAVRGKS
jgi:hypothetical protein